MNRFQHAESFGIGRQQQERALAPKGITSSKNHRRKLLKHRANAQKRYELSQGRKK